MTSARRLLYWRESWYAVVAAVVIGAPSLVWQQLHGWPFLATIGFATAHRNLTGTPLRFELGQVAAMNFLLAPLWMTGVVAPGFVERLKPVRFLSVAFVVATATVIYLRGKDYYLFPAYPTMLALGAVACAELGRTLRTIWFLAAMAAALPIVPVVLPILDPPALARYLDKTHLRPRPVEIDGVGAPLTQVFSDELGWRAMEKQAAQAYHSLSPEDRARAAIMTQNYGEAAALDVYGRAPAVGMRSAPVLFLGRAWLRRQCDPPRQWRSQTMEPDMPREQDCRPVRGTFRDAIRARPDNLVQRTAAAAPGDVGSV